MAKIVINYGEEIRTARESAKLSIRQLARRIKRSPAYICDIENGNRDLSVDMAKRIDNALGTNFIKSLYKQLSTELYFQCFGNSPRV